MPSIPSSGESGSESSSSADDGAMADGGDEIPSESDEAGGGDNTEIVFEDVAPPAATSSDAMPNLEDEETEESSSSVANAESSDESSSNSDGAQGGSPEGGDPEGGSPDGGGSSSGTSDGQGGQPVLTGSEQVAVLDGELARGTGEFDEMILRERDRVRRSATNNTGADEEPENEPGGGAAYPGSVYGEPGGGSEEVGDGGFPGGTRQGDYGQTAAVYPPPADIPSGNDDDVVARQLREAAMREADPVLREKLWNEYRKYKGIKS
jgi:hypothetical protein